MEPVIETHELTKRFGTLTAVDHINLSVLKGEIFGFLGPNGAGKTTAMRMLTTLSEPSEGTATVGGYDIVTQAEQVRRIIGLVAEKLIVYPRLSAVENLMFFGELYGLSRKQLKDRVENLLRMVHLEQFRDMPVGGYSSGMRQRVNIIRGLLHDPEILFMDEPTALLGPQSILGEDFFLGSQGVINDPHSEAMGQEQNMREMGWARRLSAYEWLREAVAYVYCDSHSQLAWYEWGDPGLKLVNSGLWDVRRSYRD